jgi:hypothetical protein
MVISADFEKQKQYFDKKKYRFMAISLYRNIACQNCSTDKGFTDKQNAKQSICFFQIFQVEF